MKVACSYNPLFLDNSLPINKNVQLIELGMEAYHHIFSNKSHELSQSYSRSLSLHLARSPIAEDEFHQDAFIKEKLLPIHADDKIISIGFHLSGSRYENIGKFGLTSHYKASKAIESNCIRFINEVEKQTKKEVWIENANFYSENLTEIIENWRSVARILESSNAKLIVDISHLIIDCVNIGVSPEIFIGCINWDRVAEIHLSGIVTGKDGALHDGHGNAVDSRAWEFFNKILKLNLLNNNAFINIEHSESSWKNNIETYQEDFLKLKTLIDNYQKIENHSERYAKSETYAISYIKKTIYSQIKNYQYICQSLNKNEDDIFDEWLNYTFSNYKRISLSKSEIDSAMESDCVYILDSFIEFVENIQ